jgi:5-methylcytosine-specific restriction protein B
MNMGGKPKRIFMEIEPYLEEYFFNQLKKVDEFRWDEIKNKLWI